MVEDKGRALDYVGIFTRAAIEAKARYPEGTPSADSLADVLRDVIAAVVPTNISNTPGDTRS